MIQGLVNGWVNAQNPDLSVVVIGGRWLVASKPYNPAKPMVEVNGYAVFVDRQLLHVATEHRHPLAALETALRHASTVASSYPEAHRIRQVSFRMTTLSIDEADAVSVQVAPPPPPDVAEHVVNLCREKVDGQLIDQDELWHLTKKIDGTEDFEAHLASNPALKTVLTVDEIDIFFRRPNLYDFG